MNWHQERAMKMAQKDNYYRSMDEWFKRFPPDSGDIIITKPIQYKPQRPVTPTKVQPPPSRPEGVSVAWLESQRQKSDQQ